MYWTDIDLFILFLASDEVGLLNIFLFWSFRLCSEGEWKIYILPNTRIVWVRPDPGLSLLQLPFLFISLILDPHKYNVPLGPFQTQFCYWSTGAIRHFELVSHWSSVGSSFNTEKYGINITTVCLYFFIQEKVFSTFLHFLTSLESCERWNVHLY